MNSATTTIGKTIKKKRKAVSPFWINEKVKSIALKVGAVILVLAILGVGAWQIKAQTSGKILPRVQIAGLKIGGKTPAQAKQIVSGYVNQLNTNGPQITYENQTINSKLPDMGVTFNVNNAINQAYAYGRTGSIFARFKENAKMVFVPHNAELAPKVDEQKLDGFLGQISKTVEIPPTNASITINNGNISVNPPKDGRGFDKTKLKNDINSLVNSGKTSGKISLAISKLTPAILEDGTVNAQKQAQQYMAAAPITVTFQDQSWTADRAEIGKWIKFKESGHELVAYTDPSSFVGYIADQVEFPAVDKEIQDQTNTVLNEGSDGRGMDRDQLTGQIQNALSQSLANQAFAVVTFTIPHGTKTIYPNAMPCRFPGRYIDINLSEQTLYAFEGCNLVNQFLISSGISIHPTPTGQFYVYSKQTVTEMKGEGYDLPGVQWVSWWSGDYSIHGTYWHHNFGHPMSHGCINATNDDALWIYNWDDIGTPVYIHY
jgi:hypothetical protein